jgi:hypothetical protein
MESVCTWKLQTAEFLVLGPLSSSAELNQECQIITCHGCFLPDRVGSTLSGRKQLWLTLRYYCGMCQEGLCKTMKYLFV